MLRRLKFTPVEELMLHQDSKGYPYTCFIRLRFDGRINKLAFDAAARRTLARHPLLGAKIDTSQWCPYWLLEDHPTPDIVWRNRQVTAQFPELGFLDCSNGGLRIHVTQDEEATDVVLQWIHACCDGLGMIQFIRDLLVLYAAEDGEELSDDALPRVELERLMGRGSFGLTWTKLAKMAHKQAIGLAGVLQFVARSPVPLIPGERDSTDSDTPQAYPAACSRHFDVETSAAIRRTAMDFGVTTNDLLASGLFSALRQYRAEGGFGDDSQWLRMLVPFNLRTKSDRYLPAANVVSSVFLDRRGADVDDQTGLLASIKDEMQLIKTNELGFTFVFSLHANRIMPGGIRRAARGEHCNSTVVFTNLGRILARCPLPKERGELICGDCRLKTIEILAPMTRLTDVAFSAAWYANRLSICLHYDPRPLTADQAEELLDTFCQQITTSAHNKATQESIL